LQEPRSGDQKVARGERSEPLVWMSRVTSPESLTGLCFLARFTRGSLSLTPGYCPAAPGAEF
jgi:hypothetical protein